MERHRPLPPPPLPPHHSSSVPKRWFCVLYLSPPFFLTIVLPCSSAFLRRSAKGRRAADPCPAPAREGRGCQLNPPPPLLTALFTEAGAFSETITHSRVSPCTHTRRYTQQVMQRHPLQHASLLWVWLFLTQISSFSYPSLCHPVSHWHPHLPQSRLPDHAHHVYCQRKDGVSQGGGDAGIVLAEGL